MALSARLESVSGPPNLSRFLAGDGEGQELAVQRPSRDQSRILGDCQCRLAGNQAVQGLRRRPTATECFSRAPGSVADPPFPPFFRLVPPVSCNCYFPTIR